MEVNNKVSFWHKNRRKLKHNFTKEFKYSILDKYCIYNDIDLQLGAFGIGPKRIHVTPTAKCSKL